MGRVLKKEFAALGLKQGDRLEPSSELPDVDTFNVQPCPFKSVFHTAGPNSRVLHISPLLSIPGVSLDTWCVDVLHTWHYGPLSTFIASALRTLLQTPIYQPNMDGLDNIETQKLALLALKAELWMYYKRKRHEEDWRKRGSEALPYPH